MAQVIHLDDHRARRHKQRIELVAERITRNRHAMDRLLQDMGLGWFHVCLSGGAAAVMIRVILGALAFAALFIAALSVDSCIVERRFYAAAGVTTVNYQTRERCKIVPAPAYSNQRPQRTCEPLHFWE